MKIFMFFLHVAQLKMLKNSYRLPERSVNPEKTAIKVIRRWKCICNLKWIAQPYLQQNRPGGGAVCHRHNIHAYNQDFRTG